MEDDRLDQLIKEVGQLKEYVARTMAGRPMVFESDELDQLFTALAKAQMEMSVAKEETVNPFFKTRYADLASIVSASRPVLAKHGLAVVQRVLPNGNGTMYLNTRLGHASGQWMESRMAITPVKDDVQSIGSYMTYLRRYTYAALVGVISNDEDDDGEKAMSQHRSKEKIDPRSEKISKSQLQILGTELEGMPDLTEKILRSFGIGKLSDMPAAQYTKTLERIKDIKRVEKGGDNE